jgi:hypothetical protein
MSAFALGAGHRRACGEGQQSALRVGDRPISTRLVQFLPYPPRLLLHSKRSSVQHRRQDRRVGAEGYSDEMELHLRDAAQETDRKWPSVAQIEALDRAGLVALWPWIMGGAAPRAMSLGLLRRFLAFEVQAGARGGLGRADFERLERLTEKGSRASSVKMAAGTRFLREWNGVTHVVERVEAGYRWNGQVFASLSAIAKLITGAHWSGPRFFGVTASARVAPPRVRPVQPVSKRSEA